jgi:VanZ family protein
LVRVLNFIKSFWIPFTVVSLVTITILSLLPLEELPPAPGSDKFQHFMAYAFLALPAALRKPRRWILQCSSFVAYSGIIELIQPSVNRYCDLFDLIANTGGVISGIIVAGLLNLFVTGTDNRRRV